MRQHMWAHINNKSILIYITRINDKAWKHYEQKLRIPFSILQSQDKILQYETNLPLIYPPQMKREHSLLYTNFFEKEITIS